jgi:2-polyprenyl-3-methyl-5-hydroxy-6-metoxy-1,4-benzoquinol methylase
MVPWRIRNFISERWPLAYHLAVNCFRNGNSPDHWDAELKRTWDAPNRQWPVKVRTISKILPLNVSVLDVGCGNGSILRGLRDHGFQNLHGLDLSVYAARRLTAEGIPTSVGTVLEMPFRDGQFDSVIASEVLEHVVRRRRFLRELKRVVRAGGTVLVSVPDDYLGPIDEPEHVIKYNKQSLADFLNRFLDVERIVSLEEPHTRACSLLAICKKPAPK